jgi:hypothetical protein
VVYILQDIYQDNKRLHRDAKKPYLKALELDVESSEIHYNYNYGLLLIDYAQAKEHAVKAYALGYPPPGLRRKRAKVGRW